MTPSAPKAWLIDLDGTLYKPTLVKLGMALELALLGWGVIKVLRKFRKSHEELREEIREEPLLEFSPTPFDEQLARTSRALSLAPLAIKKIVMSWMVERPCKWLKLSRRKALLDEIRAFRAAGGKTAIVSDYPASKKLAALGATDLFDAVVSSGEHPELKRLKPSPDGFLLAAKELGVTPEECIVLGDRADADGAAAKSAAMQFRLII